MTLVWAGGVTVDQVISKLDTEHSPRGNIVGGYGFPVFSSVIDAQSPSAKTFG